MQNNGHPISPASPARGDKLLRLLYVEDSPLDVKLAAEVLRRAGYCLTVETVDQAALFRQRLEQGAYDIITCDFNLNSWTAMEALEILKESGKDIPFLLVSGTLADEVAIECIRLGATDYILKDRMARLPLAVQRALEAKAARDERRDADAALRESAEQYRLLFEANPNPMWVSEAVTHAFLAVNDAAVRHYGYSREEFLQMSGLDIRMPGDVPEFLARMETVRAQVIPMGAEGVFKHRKKDGTLIEVETAAGPILFQHRRARLTLMQDVTERNSLQAQLLHGQKMESLGRLAGGVAHDLNNLMGVVTGYSELTLDEIERSSPLRKNIEGILNAAGQAVSVVRQLLAFGRKEIRQPRVLSLNKAVDNIAELLRHLLGEHIQLSIVTAPDLGAVKADPGQIEQIIMNLAVNARDAMPNGGLLTIQTRNVGLGEVAPRHEWDCLDGAHVMLQVRDTGCGMNAETRARAFEPFFTTKGPGKGTGLGLATTYGIVKQNGGNISVHSEPGRGTTFTICLPLVEVPPQPGSGPTISPLSDVASPVPREGAETILLAEDTEPIREVIGQFLRQGGYHVLVAQDGVTALEVSEHHDGPIHLLVTDVVMPGLTGPLLAKNLLLSHPNMQVLYMSGYTDGALAPHGVLEEGIVLLEKPFTRRSLLRKVREVLGPITSSSNGGMQ
jgi:two-component system cell cycle sensor histidine kinase/response regulator CckA